MLDPSDAVIEIRNLMKRFDYQFALRDVNLLVSQGEKIALLGPNGAGKTTLLRIIAGILRPTTGHIRVLENSFKTRHKSRIRLGFAGHQLYLYPDLSVEKNLRFHARLYGLDRVEARIDEALTATNMNLQKKILVRNLSQGMKQKLSLIRATLHQPTVLLLDEPEVSLDEESRKQLSTLLGISNHNSPTVLLATHSRELALELCNRMIFLEKGRITKDLLVTKGEHPGTSGVDDLDQLGES